MRSLANFVRNRDPRVKRKLTELHERKEREAEQRAAKKNPVFSEEDKRRLEEERQAHYEAMVADSQQYLQRLEEEFGALHLNSDSDADETAEALYCIACRKRFKTDSAFRNHERGKKHQQIVARLRQEVLLDGEDVPEASTKKLPASSGDDSEEPGPLSDTDAAVFVVHEGGADSGSDYEAHASPALEPGSEGDDDDDDDDSDESTAAPATGKAKLKKLKKKQSRQRSKQRALDPDSSSDSPEEPAAAEPLAPKGKQPKLNKTQLRKMKRQQERPAPSSPAPAVPAKAATPKPAAAAAAAPKPAAVSSSTPAPAAGKGRRRRKNKNAGDSDDEAAPPPPAETIITTNASEFMCRVCRTAFDTRNQLFQHLKKRPSHATVHPPS